MISYEQHDLTHEGNFSAEQDAGAPAAACGNPAAARGMRRDAVRNYDRILGALRAFGQSFADHARYADLLLQPRPDAAVARRIRAATVELNARAIASDVVGPGITSADVTALIAAMRGIVQTSGDATPELWHRFLDIHLAGMRATTSSVRRG